MLAVVATGAGVQTIGGDLDDVVERPEVDLAVHQRLLPGSGGGNQRKKTPGFA